MKKKEEVQKCRICGCTEDTPCMTAEGPCSWVKDDLCSACWEETKKARMEVEINNDVKSAIEELSHPGGNPYHAKVLLDRALNVAKMLAAEGIESAKDLIDWVVLDDYMVESIIIASESEIKTKAMVVDALDEMESLLEKIEANLCDPPFGDNEWARLDAVKQAVIDAKGQFQDLQVK